MEQFREIWSEVLSLEAEEIADDANFFELGGDSVKGLQMIGKAASLKFNLDLDTLYAHPTVGSLFSCLSRKSQAIKDGDSSLRLEPVTNGLDTNDLSPILEDLNFPKSRIVKVAVTRPFQGYLIQQNLQGILGLSNYIYEVEGLNILDEAQRVAKLLVSKNPILRTAIIQSSRGFFQVLLAEYEPCIIQASSLDDYISQTKLPMLPLGRPIVQFCLTKNNEGQFFLIISIHHAFFDAFSRSVLEIDLLHALRSPSTYAPEAENLWYGDFAAYLHASQRNTDAYKFWQKYMQGANVENIHAGQSSGDNPDGFLHGVIDVSTFIKGRHISSSTALIGSWALALANHSGLEDIIFAVAKLGRSYPYDGLDRMLGPLVMVAPFRLRVDDKAASTESLLHRAQKDLVSTGRHEEGLIPGAVPVPDGGPCVQSLINIKSSVSSMHSTTIESNGKGNISKISPRRDLEHWDIRASYAVYIEVTPVDKSMIVDFRYHSQYIDHEKACLLFNDFLQVMKSMELSTARSVGELLKR